MAAFLCLGLLALGVASIGLPVNDAYAGSDSPPPSPPTPPPVAPTPAPTPSINWTPAGLACMPERGTALPSWNGREKRSFDWATFNFSNGTSKPLTNMPACHCPPSSYCPRDFGEWSTHPRMPRAQANVCCPRPNLCQIDQTVSTGCDGRNGTTPTFHGFCTEYKAVELPAVPANQAENKLRKDTAASLNTCLNSCKALVRQIINTKPASRNVEPHAQLVNCERSCRVTAAQALGFNTSSTTISGRNVGPTETPAGGNNPTPNPVVTLLESKLTCKDEDVVGYCLTEISESCGGDDDDGGSDCLASGSKITMADGSLKNIEDVKAGDEIKGYTTINTVKGTSFNFTINQQIFSVNHDSLVVTEGHPLLTENGWKAITPEKISGDAKDVSKLAVGDVILREGADPLTVTHLTPITAGANTDRHNLSVDGDGTFIANGVILRGFKLNVQY